MKKIFFTLVIMVSTSLSSCDWLDVDPENSRTTDNFFTSAYEMEQSLTGIYNGLLPVSYYSFLMSEVRSDNVVTRTSDSAQRDYIDIATFRNDITTITTLNDAWVDLYAIIARVNLFLENIEEITFTTADVDIKSSFIGEARFLRALAYFELVRYFGRVPLVLRTLTTEEAMATGQSEDYEIYEQAIIPDLLYAEESMLETPVDYLGNTVASGRATRIAATALLGRVYITMAGYPLYDDTKSERAQDQFKEVIDYAGDTKYWAPSAYDWVRIWISENDNMYHIFEIQYVAQKGYGNPMVHPSVSVKNNTDYVSIEMSGNSIKGSQLMRGLYSSADIRYEATYDADNKFLTKFFEHKIKRANLGYESIDGQIIDRTCFPLNYPLIRLEDIMLMYAELTGPTQEACELVNRIRKRAGLDELTDAQKSDDAFAAIVDEERRRELAGEGIRWHDLVRHNNLEAIKTNFIKEGNSTLVSRVIDGTHLYPIPDVQMKVKEGLYQQNPAY